jgi:hypothetical protein
MKKNLIILFLFLIAFEVQAQVYIKSKELDPSTFSEVVSAQEGESLSEWLLKKESLLEKSDVLVNLSEKFLQSEIGANEFIDLINNLKKESFFDLSSQQFLLSVFKKKFPESQWPQNVNSFICHFQALKQSPDFKSLNLSCPELLWNPKDLGLTILDDETLFVDGLAIHSARISGPLKTGEGLSQIYIVSDSRPRFIDNLEISRTMDKVFDRQIVYLAQGSCENVKSELSLILKLGLKPENIRYVFENGCIKSWPRVTDQSEGQSFTRPYKSSWLWIGIAGLAAYLLLKNKEIIIEK